METTPQVVPEVGRSPTPIPPVLAPALMMSFWMLLGAAAGIKLAQNLWQLLGWGTGEVSVAVPVGGVAGAIVGALLGLISNPRLLVLLMAVFAGSSAGAVAGKIPWGDIGEIGGQVGGGLMGGLAWAVWLFVGDLKAPKRRFGMTELDPAPGPSFGVRKETIRSVNGVTHAESRAR